MLDKINRNYILVRDKKEKTFFKLARSSGEG